MTAGLEFLTALDQRIWTVRNEGHRPSNRSIGQYRIENHPEKVTQEDWETVKKLIKAHALICVPGSGVFGLGRSIAFYRQPDAAPFPGTEEEFQPEFLLCLTNQHLEKMFPGYETWWKEMEPLVYNKKNEGLIKKFLKEPLREKSYYEY